ncbi:MAG: hypothetical protein AAF571_05785 [Verrucomicrobiota bacterium]
MKKWFIGTGIGLVLIIVAFLSIPRGITPHRIDPHGNYLKQLGAHLFVYQNDRDGVYPALDVILSEIHDDNIIKMTKDPNFQYFRPLVKHRDLDVDYILMIYEIPEKGRWVYTAGVNYEFKRYKN